MPSKDPRSYVRVLPLPTPSDSDRGSKLRTPTRNARTAIRDDIYKTNYQRRQEQITSQGFWSVSHKPYRGIGDPFYLDEKKLILHSLGQWDENEDADGSSSSEDDEMQPSHMPSPVRPMTAAKFVLRRTRTDLNTLHKDVANSKNLIRNVRLGYGFFDLIRQQQQAKNEAAMAEKRKKLEAARNEWQAPKSDSESESDIDEELSHDIDIDRFTEWSNSEDENCDQARNMTSSMVNFDNRGRVTFSRMSTRSRPLSGASKWRKVAQPRPYTPQHTNLSDVGSPDVEKEALFRQLCVLNWILEAMNIEHGSEMSPITQSWARREVEIGGFKQQQSKVRIERSDKLKWEQIVTNTPSIKIKKSSIFKSRPMGRRSTFLGARSSISPPPSSASSSLQLNAMATQEKPNTVNKENSDSITEEEPNDAPYNRSMFRFLDEYYESLRKESVQGQGQEETNHVTDSRPRRKSDAKRKEIRMTDADGRISRKSKTPERTSTDADISNEKQQTVHGHRGKKSSDEYRANLHMIRPRSTIALMDYQAQLPSNKHTPMTQEMRQKFSEVLEDKALTLHDILEQIDQDRMLKCQNKFIAMKAEGHNFHKNLRAMRLGSEGLVTRPTTEQLKKKSTFKGNWYTDLVSSIPAELKEKWFYQKILNKLGNFGLVENTSKQSVYKFLKVLETIREWEICSPDISAAIEFCREKIVEMTVEEFEEWFCQQFPKIIRPQTAPPTRSRKREESQTHSRKSSAKAETRTVHIPA